METVTLTIDNRFLTLRSNSYTYIKYIIITIVIIVTILLALYIISTINPIFAVSFDEDTTPDISDFYIHQSMSV